MNKKMLSQEVASFARLVRDVELGGTPLAFLQKEVRLLLGRIRESQYSLRDFSMEHAKDLAVVLNYEGLSESLRSKLSHCIYGADERSRYFTEGSWLEKVNSD